MKVFFLQLFLTACKTTYKPGAIFELMFQCWTLYEKCSETESGVENKLLINMNFLKKVFLILVAQFSIEHPGVLVTVICGTEFTNYLALIVVLLMSGGSQLLLPTISAAQRTWIKVFIWCQLLILGDGWSYTTDHVHSQELNIPVPGPLSTESCEIQLLAIFFSDA